MIAMVLGGIGLAAFAGCAEPAAEPAPAAAPESPEAAPTAGKPDMVARVDIEPGHAVNFYEPSPGNLVVVEAMAPGQKFVLAADAISDALRAYAQLRPQDEVPQRSRRPTIARAARQASRRPPRGTLRVAAGLSQPSPRRRRPVRSSSP
jgi:hypothetical protein